MSPSTLSLRPVRTAGPNDIHCPTCRKLIFDGDVLLARVTRFSPEFTEACCKICKTWVKVPVVIATGSQAHGVDPMPRMPAGSERHR